MAHARRGSTPRPTQLHPRAARRSTSAPSKQAALIARPPQPACRAARHSRSAPATAAKVEVAQTHFPAQPSPWRAACWMSTTAAAVAAGPAGRAGPDHRGAAAGTATGAADETIETNWNRPTGVISTNPNDPFVQQAVKRQQAPRGRARGPGRHRRRAGAPRRRRRQRGGAAGAPDSNWPRPPGHRGQEEREVSRSWGTHRSGGSARPLQAQSKLVRARGAGMHNRPGPAPLRVPSRVA